ncbi:MAG: class I SAM-dependent methyltransferase [Planctomycetota bacterium]
MPLLRKLKTALLMALRIPFHAAMHPRLVWRRYVQKRCVVGAIPYQLRLHNRYWEKRLGVDTEGWVAVELNDGMLYEATPYLLLEDILCYLNLGKNDVFLDLGCGKGRVTCMAARTKVGRVVGLEQDDGFLELARRNLAAVADVRSKVDFHHGLAQDFDFDSTTVVFLFNPFGADTLQEVLELLQQSLLRIPRKLRLVYANPVHEQVLHDCAWLSNVETWPSSAYAEFEIQPPNPRLVSFWESKA